MLKSPRGGTRLQFFTFKGNGLTANDDLPYNETLFLLFNLRTKPCHQSR